MFQTVLSTSAQTNKYYTVKELHNILINFVDEEKIRTQKKISYYNIPCAFDIETTSIKVQQSSQMDKQAFMYIWQFCIGGFVVIGRTWDEFIELYDKLVEFFDTSRDKHLIIYVHNLGFEFQFIRKRLKWETVFSLDNRKPVKAVTIDGIEFRCSYILSGYSLAKLSDQLTKYKITKKTGDLDYSKIRNEKTPLTEKEISYCINDVLVVVAYIQELIEREGDITKLPITKTGFVRKYCRDMCMYDGNHKNNTAKYGKYHRLMKGLTIDKTIYLLLQQAFAGGFTHGNPKYIQKIMKNVDSFDFSSAYPYVMLSEQYPMSVAQKYMPTDIEDFNKNLKLYCCLFTIEIIQLSSKITYDNYISASHCIEKEMWIENNGRVVSADRIVITVTEQDFNIIKRTYKWENLRILTFYRFKKDYLPRDFMLAILKLFGDKTVLKGVENKEVEYLISKENLNSCYGMTVTDPCRDEIIYEENEWEKEDCDFDTALAHYNKSAKRFLYYPWGIWVTAYNRRNLWSGIMEFKDDYIYSDTDSIKVINKSRHMDYINNYNKWVLQKLQLAFLERNIDISLTRPKNKYGVEKQLGIWDYEGQYKRFKCLGAKRYMTETDNGISITVSGLNKKVAVPYLLEKYKNKVFEKFDDNLYVPPEYTGKMTHTYIDEEFGGTITDYLGNKATYHEYSATHLEPCDYSLSLSDKFVKFLLGYRQFTK